MNKIDTTTKQVKDAFEYAKSKTISMIVSAAPPQTPDEERRLKTVIDCVTSGIDEAFLKTAPGLQKSFAALLAGKLACPQSDTST